MTQILRNPSGCSSGGPLDIRIVLIDQDIEGIDEADPPKILEAEDILGEYVIVFQDPPSDDLNANPVENLSLWGYHRRRLKLKYFKADPISHSGTAQAGSTSTSINLATSASSEDDYYIDATVRLVGGMGEGQSRIITAYDGDTQVATVTPAWGDTPNHTTLYEVASPLDRVLATEIIDDSESDPPRKIVRYATTHVYYDDGADFKCGEYGRANYPDYDENADFPPSGLPDAFLSKRYRGIAINGVLVTAFCKELPPPPLPEEE